jgi:hypothetical protein
MSGRGLDRKDSQTVALVELDMQKLRPHIVLSREAVTERLKEPGSTR